MTRVKYIHIFNFGSFYFDSMVINMINDSSTGFVSIEHLFVIRDADEFEKLQHYDNVILDDKKKGIIQKYCSIADWVILHGLQSINELNTIRKKHLSKIIWRSWGSDTGYLYQEGELLKNLIKYLLNSIKHQKVKQICAIGAGNLIDKLDIVERYGNVLTFDMPYISNEFEILSEVEKQEHQKRDYLNILVGHSGYPNDNHMVMIDMLKKYSDKKVIFNFVLSYGNPAYMEQVRKYARATLGEKAFFLDMSLDYKSYTEFICNMDVAILDGRKSYALGTIAMLVFFKKKILVNRKSIIRRAFEQERVPYHCTDELESMKFEELSSPAYYQGDVGKDLSILSYHVSCAKWEKLFAYLDNRNLKVTRLGHA